MSEAYKQILKKLNLLVQTSKPESAMRFFKTGAGSYSSHDYFLGLRMPDLRALAKEHPNLNTEDLNKLLDSKYNEYRALALVILYKQYQSTKTEEKRRLRNFYLEKLKSVNNWNLVDLSAHIILSDPLDFDLLKKLCLSKHMWERRVGIVATWGQNKLNNPKPTFELAKLLLYDKEDLMHKATGWMLREAGKKDLSALKAFLDQHAAIMPRTMLRYSIERLPEEIRQHYLKLDASKN